MISFLLIILLQRKKRRRIQTHRRDVKIITIAKFINFKKKLGQHKLLCEELKTRENKQCTKYSVMV